MDQASFDALTRWVRARADRRDAIRLLGGATLAAALGGARSDPDAVAKRRVRGEHNVRGNKVIMCVNGVTTRAPKKKRKKYLKQGATRGACSGCTPVCNGVSCGGDDGCGGTCGCATGSVCAAGTCRVCTVSCTGDAPACGAALQTALDGGGDISICPGRYTPPVPGGFFVSAPTRLYGAGSDDDPATASILDQQGASGSIVVQIGGKAGQVTLSGLRITGGNDTGGYAGGIYNDSPELLTITDCAVIDNTSVTAGGLYTEGPVTVTGSLFSGNEGGRYGAIYIEHLNDNLTSTIRSTVITANTGSSSAGGVYFYTTHSGDTLVVEASTQVTNNITGNAPGYAGGLMMDYSSTMGVATATGATVTGNTTPQCIDVTGC